MGWLGYALLLTALPLRAQPVYTVHVPHAGLDSRLEISVGAWNGQAAPGEAISTTVGEWEVTVEFDAAHCAVYCEYRRVRDVSGRTPLIDLLPPPVTTIRFYADGQTRPELAVVDPAGTRLPRVTARAAASYEHPCTGGRRACGGVLVEVREHAARARAWTGAPESSFAPEHSVSNLPLRI